MDSVRECVVHLDGVDKTGKDTIRDILVSRSKGKLLVYDRSVISQIAYSRMFGRELNERFFLDSALASYNKGDFFFYLKAPADIIEERIKVYDEMPIDVESHLSCFSSVVDEVEKHGVFVHTLSTHPQPRVETTIEAWNIITHSQKNRGS